MAPPRTGAPLEAIRVAADEAVRADSLRSVARAVGMSPTGLRNFLDGRSPYSATLRKLTAWYVRYELSREVFSAEVAQAGVSVLLEAIPEAQLAPATERLLDFLGSLHQDSRVRPPPWLDVLRDGGG